MFLAACQGKKQTPPPPVAKSTGPKFDQAKAAATKMFGDFNTQVGGLQRAAPKWRARVDALPEDRPGVQDARSKMLAIEETLRVDTAKAQWLSGALNTAVSSGSEEQVHNVETASAEAWVGSLHTLQALGDLSIRVASLEAGARHRKAKSPKP
jgi:hypothetical protein